MQKIKIAIAGIGNCASSLVQGIDYYRDKLPEEAIGLMHWEIGGCRSTTRQTRRVARSTQSAARSSRASVDRAA